MGKRKKVNKQKSIIFKFLVIGAILVAVVLTAKIITQNQSPQSKNVLGLFLSKGGDQSDSDDDSSGSGGSGSSGSSSSGNESSGSSGNGNSGSSDSNGKGSSESSPSESGSSGTGSSRVINPTTGIRTETKTEQDEEKTEIRFSETERIKTRTKDGKTRIDITAGGVKTRLEMRDDRIVIKAEQEDGTEVELEDNTIFKIEERLATNQIKIATDEANKFVIQRGTTGAVSQFPLSIDLATNTLMVNTPSGQKNVTVLPDQAVQNLIATNIVSRLGGSTVVNVVRTGEVSKLSQVVTLGEQNGVPIYEINGISDQKLLGFIPVTIEKTVEVSAETGIIVSTKVSLVNRILDAISF